MSKRINLTVSDSVFEDLQLWATQQGRSVGNLTAFLVEVSIREAKERGEFPIDSSDKGSKKNS